MTTQTKIKKERSLRDEFIIKKYQQGFTPTEIVEILLPRNGFQKIARSRVYQILEQYGISIRSKKK